MMKPVLTYAGLMLGLFMAYSPSAMAEPQADNAGRNSYTLGIGGQYGNVGLSYEHYLSDSLILGMSAASEAGKGFYWLSGKMLFKRDRPEFQPFVSLTYGGISNDTYGDLSGSLIGLGYRRNHDRYFTELSFATWLFLDAPYTIISRPLYVGFRFGKRF